jgi:hypothetical protein
VSAEGEAMPVFSVVSMTAGLARGLATVRSNALARFAVVLL